MSERVEVDDSQLSISNALRKSLSGPQYLDSILFTENGTNIAVELCHLQHEKTTITYDHLQSLADKLAYVIQQRLLDPGPQPIVPVMIPQSLELYIACLAILKCGFAFCPIAPDTPRERLSFIIHDLSPDFVVCTAEAKETLSTWLPDLQSLAIDTSDITKISGTVSKSSFKRTPMQTAYVMYTSGSTGTPKGVIVSHQAVCQSLLAHNSLIPHFRRFLQFAAPTFDVSLFEIFFTWFR